MKSNNEGISRELRIDPVITPEVHNVLVLKPVPAVYIGCQNDWLGRPVAQLYRALKVIGNHPAGSTLSLSTFAKFGYVPATFSSF